MAFDPGMVELPGGLQIQQQPVEQRDIRAGCDRQMHIRPFRGRGPARIDHDDPRPVGLPAGEQALMQHRMAPGGVGADQDDQVRFLPVLVDAGDHVLTKRADMAGDG